MMASPNNSSRVEPLPSVPVAESAGDWGAFVFATLRCRQRSLTRVVRRSRLFVLGLV